MIDLKHACMIVRKNNPDMKPISCVELEQYYSFNMIPKELDETDGFANSSVYLVDKTTGHHRVAYFLEVVNEPILRRYEQTEL